MFEDFKKALKTYSRYCKKSERANRTSEYFVYIFERDKNRILKQIGTIKYERQLAVMKAAGVYDPKAQDSEEEPPKKNITVIRREIRSPMVIKNPDPVGPEIMGFYSQSMRLFYCEYMVNEITKKMNCKINTEKLKELSLLKLRFQREYEKRLHNKLAGDPSFYENPLQTQEIEIPTNKAIFQLKDQLPLLPYFDLNNESDTFAKILGNIVRLNFYNGFIDRCNGYFIWGELYTEEMWTTEEGWIYIPKKLGKEQMFRQIMNQLVEFSDYRKVTLETEEFIEDELHKFITSPKKIMDVKPPKVAGEDPRVLFYVNHQKNCVEFIYRRKGTLDHTIGSISLINNNLQQILQDLLYQLYLGFFSKKAKK